MCWIVSCPDYGHYGEGCSYDHKPSDGEGGQSGSEAGCYK